MRHLMLLFIALLAAMALVNLARAGCNCPPGIKPIAMRPAGFKPGLKPPLLTGGKPPFLGGAKPGKGFKVPKR